MKYTEYIKHLAIIILFFCIPLIINAQEKTLKVGDKAPPINVLKWIKGDAIKEFRKGHIYVVEFGATWCAPCKKAIPELTKLQKKYGDKITVIGNFIMEVNQEPLDTKNPQYKKVVEDYVDDMGSDMEYHVAVDGPQKAMENNWVRAAGFSGIPVSFVIDKDGYIAWFGHNLAMVDRLIKAMIDGEYKLEDAIAHEQNKKEHQDKQANKIKEFLYGGKNEDVMFRSVLNKYQGDTKDRKTPGYIWGYVNASDDFDPQKYHGIICMSLNHLYTLAYRDTLDFRPWYDDKNKKLAPTSYGIYWREPIIEVSDQSKFNNNWGDPTEKWNYSLKVPREKATAKFLQTAMQRDLQTYFGYEVTVETRKKPYYRLTATKEAHQKLKTKTPGAKPTFEMDKTNKWALWNTVTIDFLINQLWLSHQLEIPFVNETGIEGEVDLKLIARDDLDKLSKVLLEENGLILEKDEKDFKVVVIRDPKN